MPTDTDGLAQRTTSEQRLSELAGIAAPLRQDWANRGRLRRRGRQGYEETDAVELVALKALVDVLGALDGPVAWDEIRQDFGDRADEPDLVLVFDHQDKEAAIVSDIAALRSAIRDGHRTGVIDLADPVGRARTAFRRIIAGL